MTRTARRRWTREFEGEIDGIAIGTEGPVLVHGYDPPAGGKWIDDVIPGKLAAYERSTGEQLWMSPCEVGYGRGFGCGLVSEEELVVLGPSLQGHRIARMAAGTGELIGAEGIQPFDQALVHGDMCVTITPARVCGIMTPAMLEVWTYQSEGHRYHVAGRDGQFLYVAYTDGKNKLQGVQKLDVESGDFERRFLAADHPVIHDLVAGDGLVVLLVGDKAPGAFRRSSSKESLAILAFSTKSSEATPLWRLEVANESHDELPDVSISLDSGKVYAARGAMVEVYDGLSGRSLGELTMPGLDERIAWQVSQGAGLLAEETRVSVFELPA